MNIGSYIDIGKVNDYLMSFVLLFSIVNLTINTMGRQKEHSMYHSMHDFVYSSFGLGLTTAHDVMRFGGIVSCTCSQ